MQFFISLDDLHLSFISKKSSFWMDTFGIVFSGNFVFYSSFCKGTPKFRTNFDVCFNTLPNCLNHLINFQEINIIFSTNPVFFSHFVQITFTVDEVKENSYTYFTLIERVKTKVDNLITEIEQSSESFLWYYFILNSRMYTCESHFFYFLPKVRNNTSYTIPWTLSNGKITTISLLQNSLNIVIEFPVGHHII